MQRIVPIGVSEGVRRSRKWVAASSKLAVGRGRTTGEGEHDVVSGRNADVQDEEAGHGLVYFGVEREALLAVEDVDADVDGSFGVLEVEAPGERDGRLASSYAAVTNAPAKAVGRTKKGRVRMGGRSDGSSPSIVKVSIVADITSLMMTRDTYHGTIDDSQRSRMSVMFVPSRRGRHTSRDCTWVKVFQKH